MPICVRLAMPGDREQMQSLSRAAAFEKEPDQVFDDAVFDRVFAEALTGHPTLYVAAVGGRLLGFTLSEIGQFHFNAGLIADLTVIYVSPDKRGTRVSALLMANFVQWGELVGCIRYTLSADNPATAERTARFFERFGARRVGISMVI